MTMRIPSSTSHSAPKPTGSFDHLGSHIPMGRPSIDSKLTLGFEMSHVSHIAAVAAHPSANNTFSIKV